MFHFWIRFIVLITIKNNKLVTFILWSVAAIVVGFYLFPNSRIQMIKITLPVESFCHSNSHKFTILLHQRYTVMQLLFVADFFMITS